jgi:hypothetical protein
MALPGRRPRAVESAGEGAVRVAQPIQGTPAPRRMRLPAGVAVLVAAFALSACGLEATTTPGAPSPTPGTSAAGPSSSASTGAGASVEPSPGGAARLQLPAPAGSDPTPITYSIRVQVKAGASGQLVLVVHNDGDKIVEELVLRWPTAVRDTIFLAPFTPSQQRIREGGDPLVQDWTSWVDGPGEDGEPAGTTSLGWGPLLVGGTLTIPILATRVAPGPIAFDMQILSGQKLLSSAGTAAWFTVSVP